VGDGTIEGFGRALCIRPIGHGGGNPVPQDHEWAVFTIVE
jgi:hypothetical protein